MSKIPNMDIKPLSRADASRQMPMKVILPDLDITDTSHATSHKRPDASTLLTLILHIDHFYIPHHIMTLPSVPDSGEDPTMQIPWPSAASRTRPQSDTTVVVENDVVVPTEEVAKVSTSTTDTVKPRLTTWNLITLSISMAGAQIAWTVELGYDRI